MASGREVIMALRVAAATGYVDAQRVAREIDAKGRIVATLYSLASRARLARRGRRSPRRPRYVSRSRREVAPERRCSS